MIFESKIVQIRIQLSSTCVLDCPLEAHTDAESDHSEAAHYFLDAESIDGFG